MKKRDAHVIKVLESLGLRSESTLTDDQQKIIDNNLFEIFDNSSITKWKWTEKYPSHWFAEFYIEEDRINVDFFMGDSKNEFELIFERNGSVDITGGGHATIIFSTVIDIAKDFIEQHPTVTHLYYTAKEPSRVSLYKHMTQKIAKLIGWNHKIKGNNFYVVRP